MKVEEVEDVHDGMEPHSDCQVKPKTPIEALKVFGHSSFRAGQEESIREVMDNPDGVLCVFPTGHGKSMVYQIPSLIQDGVTIVVSPLISLMQDQVEALQDIGINALLINSTVPDADVEMALAEVYSGDVPLLYIAPERFRSSKFIDRISGLSVSLFAVDEAHCISKWGNDFRPAYSELGKAIQLVGPERIVALTATATKEVQDDICKILGIPNARRFVKGVYRDNLIIRFIPATGDQRLSLIARIAKSYRGKGEKTGVVYTNSKKGAEKVASYLRDLGIPASYYHAGMPLKERRKVQESWSKNGGIIAATTAFGMGIDRPDVRFVINCGIAQSVEDWYQQIGRAGRDGKDSLCVTIADLNFDYKSSLFLIDMVTPRGSDVRSFWNWLQRYSAPKAQSGEDFADVSLQQKMMVEYSSVKSVGACIGFLKKRGLVESLCRGKYRVKIRSDVEFDSGEINKVRMDKVGKLNKVCDLFRTDGCIYRKVVDYFGDGSLSSNCGKCGGCSKK